MNRLHVHTLKEHLNRFCNPILLVAAATLVPLLHGCAPRAVPADTSQTPANTPSSDALKTQLDEVLSFTLAERDLSIEQHAAWQILHGVLAFRSGFLVQHEGKLVSTVDYLLGGGRMKGWTVQVASREDGKPGLRAIMEAGSQTGQGHPDQWLAVLAQCNLSLDQSINIGDESLTMQDFIAQVQWDVPRNFDREYSWTLIGLTHYLPTDSKWHASDGQIWSIERLVQIEAEQGLGDSACGGTHRVIGLTMALNQHMEAGGQLTGAWTVADKVIERAIIHAQQFQNTDGSFSTRYFEGPGSSPDLAQNLGTTGHILEFLVLALDPEELQEPWVRRAVANLCKLFQTTRNVPLECGALYHAAHALVLYRDRAYSKNTRRSQEPPR